jgi:hypothetical protein
MTRNSGHVHACPQCGGEVSRVHRHLRDRALSFVLRIHRYRCGDPQCGWEGVVSVPRPPSPRRKWLAWASSPTVGWGARVAWMLVGAVSVLAPIEGGRYLIQREHDRAAALLAASLEQSEPQLLAPLPGDSFDGLLLATYELPTADNPSPLQRRQACMWGVPGRNPYKGTVRQVLAGANLPPDVVHKIENLVQRRRVSGRVEISNKGIWTENGHRRFDTNVVAMGFGNTLCLNTKVNFPPAHVEAADLYEATDSYGQKYSIMVPYACGNVAVLAERAEQPPPPMSVPEPQTLASVLVGLAAMAWVMRRHRVPRHAATPADNRSFHR